jgi:hypothetical protein
VDSATEAEGLKVAYLGLSLALVSLLDPRLPLLHVQESFYDMPRDATFDVMRNDWPTEGVA